MHHVISFPLCFNVAFYMFFEPKKDIKIMQLIWQKSVFMRVVISQYNLCSGSTRFWFSSSKRESPLTVHTSHKKSQSYLITSDLTLPHLRDVVSGFKSLNALLLYNTGPSLILKGPAILIFSQLWRQYNETPHWEHLWHSNNVWSSASARWQFLCFSVKMCTSLSTEKMTLPTQADT